MERRDDAVGEEQPPANAARAERGGGPPLRYVALGDSLTVGVGSFPGYPPRVAARLRRELGRPVSCTNLGQIRMTSVDLVRALQHQPRFRSAVLDADLITLCIGGNDLLRCETDEECLQRSVAAFGRRWANVCRAVRDLNPAVPLVALTLYSPYPPGHARADQSRRWVEATNQLIADAECLKQHGITLVDIGEVLHGRQRDLTWITLGDIHPTGYGQRRIAAAVTSACCAALRGAGPGAADPVDPSRAANCGPRGGSEGGEA